MKLSPLTAPVVPTLRPLAPAARTTEPRVEAPNTFEPAAGPARAPRATDGRAFVSSAIDDIKARTAAGQPSTVVFDIDDTLTDTRARTLAIAHEYDAKNGTHHFDGLKLEDVTFPPTAMSRKAGLTTQEARAFDRAWQPEFFSEKAMDHDLGIPAMIQLAKDAAAAGAEVLFLTGRSEEQRDATLGELVRLGLPQAETGNLVMFQDGQNGEFKADQLDAWAKGGKHLSFFITDSRGDVGLLQRRGLDIPAVLFDSPMSDPNAPVSAQTPVFPFPAAEPELWA